MIWLVCIHGPALFISTGPCVLSLQTCHPHSVKQTVYTIQGHVVDSPLELCLTKMNLMMQFHLIPDKMEPHSVVRRDSHVLAYGQMSPAKVLCYPERSRYMNEVLVNRSDGAIMHADCVMDSCRTP